MTQRAKRRAKQRRQAERKFLKMWGRSPRGPSIEAIDSFRQIIENGRATLLRNLRSISLDVEPFNTYSVGDGWRSAFSSSQFEQFQVLAREATEQQQQIQDAISQICKAILSNPRTPKWVEEICSEGYTEPFFQEGCWWEFPPNGVMPVQLKRSMGKGLFDSLPRASEVERLEALRLLPAPAPKWVLDVCAEHGFIDPRWVDDLGWHAVTPSGFEVPLLGLRRWDGAIANHSPQEILYSDPLSEDCIPLQGFNHPPFNCSCHIDGNTLVIQYTTDPVIERIDVDIFLE